jgi:hypothetical protein
MRLRLLPLLLFLLLVSGLSAQDDLLPYQNPELPIEERVTDLLSRMTLEEKLGQMTLIEKNSIHPDDVTKYFIGGVLSGGGGYPISKNTPQAWFSMVKKYQDAALGTPLGIPVLYGVDAVHGHATVEGSVIFPHNIGLGAAQNPELVEDIGRITASEMIATGIYWNYSPVHYSQSGRFDHVVMNPDHNNIGIIIVGEHPYSEWFGDDEHLTLPILDRIRIKTLREQVDALIVILISGRPIIINDTLNSADAFVVAWLPGTEGSGVADVLFGERDFTGTLPFTWVRNMNQLPFDFANLPMEGCSSPLFPFGYGLTYANNEASTQWLELAESCR